MKLRFDKIALSIFILVSLTGFDAPKSPPLWISPTYRELNFPRSDYYVGFASRSFSKEEDVSEVEQQVLSFARVRLVESVYVSIAADSYNSVTNADGEAEEFYSKKIVSRSALETAGLATEVYLDNRKKIAYAFSSIKKVELLNNYEKAFAVNFEAIERQMNEVSTMPMPQMRQLLDEIRQLQGQRNVLSFLGAEIGEKVQQLNEFALGTQNAILDESKKQTGLEEALSTLQSILFSTLNPVAKAMKINLLTYKDSGLSSEFSLVLNQKLTQGLLENVEISDQSDFVLTGTYWPGREGIRLMVSVNELQAGENIRLLGTASATINESSISGLDVKIEPDFPSSPVLSNSQEKAAYGGLIADVTTQKGKEAVAFTEGEELKVAVKVSRPAYVQLINIWADGSKFLLLDNYYLGSDEVNKNYWLPFSWETACPCGMENLYLRASNRPFLPMEVVDVDGFMKLETDIEVVLELTRGFKPKTDEDYLAEASLDLMTFPK